MLPKDFTPDVIEDPTKPGPTELPAQSPTEIQEPETPRPPASVFPVHPEPTPDPEPRRDTQA